MIDNNYNFKPALYFDCTYGTNIHTYYKFPFGLNADEAFNILTPYWKESLEKTNLIESLNDSHFPFDIKNLTFEQKYHILQGMAAGLPIDDIIYFSVDDIKDYMNNDIKSEMKCFSLKTQWVVSPKTWNKIKEQLKIEELV